MVVLNACNSGFWPIAGPLMRAGIPAVIGVQGVVSNIAALYFAEKFYESLAVGLSLDEALTYARLYVMRPERSHNPCDWGRFMAYMPTDSAVPFPRSESAEIRFFQRQSRSGRESAVESIRSLTQEMDGPGVSRLLSEVASRSVLILGRFSEERKAILDLIARELTALDRGYIPVIFDFDKPENLDLIESVLRFAGVSRFIIADISDPKSVPAELQQIVPSYPSVPVALIIDEKQREYPVSDNILRRPSVLPLVRYRDGEHLRSIFAEQLLTPAESLRSQLMPRAVV